MTHRSSEQPSSHKLQLFSCQNREQPRIRLVFFFLNRVFFSGNKKPYLISITSALLSSYFFFHSLTSISFVMIYVEKNRGIIWQQPIPHFKVETLHDSMSAWASCLLSDQGEHRRLVHLAQVDLVQRPRRRVQELNAVLFARLVHGCLALRRTRGRLLCGSKQDRSWEFLCLTTARRGRKFWSCWNIHLVTSQHLLYPLSSWRCASLPGALPPWIPNLWADVWVAQWWK